MIRAPPPLLISESAACHIQSRIKSKKRRRIRAGATILRCVHRPRWYRAGETRMWTRSIRKSGSSTLTSQLALSSSLSTIYLFDSLVPPLRKSFAVFLPQRRSKLPSLRSHTRDHVGLVGRLTADPHFSLISMDVGDFRRFSHVVPHLFHPGFSSLPSVWFDWFHPDCRHDGRNYICRFYLRANQQSNTIRKRSYYKQHAPQWVAGALWCCIGCCCVAFRLCGRIHARGCSRPSKLFLAGIILSQVKAATLLYTGIVCTGYPLDTLDLIRTIPGNISQLSKVEKELKGGLISTRLSLLSYCKSS